MRRCTPVEFIETNRVKLDSSMVIKGARIAILHRHQNSFSSHAKQWIHQTRNRKLM